MNIDVKYIPLDKSWIIRMGILDIVHGYSDIQKFLSAQKNLGDDLLALQKAAKVWKTNKPVDVGESGTLYRLLKFASWKLDLHKRFVTKGTLLNRKITDDPSIVNLPQSKLLKLDNGTSQWASAAALLGDKERLPHPPFKLGVTYDAIRHWTNRRKKNESWEPKYDKTILAQAETYIRLIVGKKSRFIPRQAEDFCFAYAFGYMTARNGEKKWPALRGHESDRIVEIQNMLARAKKGQKITSKDHRVVQAIVMWGRVNDKKVGIMYPNAVNKSWPQFWDFLEKTL